MASKERGLDLFRIARIFAVDKYPYFSTLLYSLSFVKTDKVDSIMVTDQLAAYYNPEVEMEVEEAAWILIHDIFHILMQHPDRVGDRHKEMWNKAADLEINDDLVQMKDITPPNQPIMPADSGMKDGKSAEEYY